VSQLLDEPDWDIFYWAVEKRTPPERWQGTSLLEKCVPLGICYVSLADSMRCRLKKHAKNEGRVVRVMPELDHEGKI
jgi:succinate dehydrogenase assembly factor 2